MCLLCFYRFSELPEAVLGDFLLNGRRDGMSRTKESSLCSIQTLILRFGYLWFIGRHQQDQNTTNGKRITRKWPLDLSSTANKVRAFRTVFLFDVFDLIRVEKHIKICA